MLGVVPRIETARLSLREHRATDYAELVDLWQNPAVYRHITGTPSGTQEVWMRLLRYGGLWTLLGYGYWAVEERASRRYVGEVGFADFKRGLQGFDSQCPEAGWILHPDVAGQGYAREAMGAACGWLDANQPSQGSFCIIAPDNRRSIRLAEHLGYVHALDTSLGEDPTGVYLRGGAAGRLGPSVRG